MTFDVTMSNDSLSVKQTVSGTNGFLITCLNTYKTGVRFDLIPGRYSLEAESSLGYYYQDSITVYYGDCNTFQVGCQ